MCSFQVFCQPICFHSHRSLRWFGVFCLTENWCKVDHTKFLSGVCCHYVTTHNDFEHGNDAFLLVKFVAKTNYNFKMNFWPFIKLHTNLCTKYSHLTFGICNHSYGRYGICSRFGPCVTMQLSASVQFIALKQKPSIITNQLNNFNYITSKRRMCQKQLKQNTK